MSDAERKRLALQYLALQVKDDLTRCRQHVSQHIKDLGYQQLDVKVENAETGEIVDCFRTYRKPGWLPVLGQELRDAASIPDELMEELTAYVPEAGRKVSLGEIIKRQLLGGRPQGTSEDMAALHRRRVRVYIGAIKSGELWGVRDFCKEWGISERTLYRAFEFVEEHGPDDLRQELARIRNA